VSTSPSAAAASVAASRVWLKYAVLALVWGSSFLLIKIGVEGLTPLQVVLARLVFGALALAAVSVVLRIPLPRAPIAWLHLSVLSVVLCVVPFTLFAWAEEHIPSGLASIYNATTPLMTMLVALVALPGERPDRRRLTGLALGFAGVLIVLAPWRGLEGDLDVVAQLACLGAAACYGIALVHLRRFVAPLGLHSVQIATVQVSVAAVLAAAVTLAVPAAPPRLEPGVIVAMAALGVLGTGLAYVWNTDVVAGLGPTAASTVTYLTPIVGVALGVAVLGESVGWYQPVGAAVVLLGVAVGQGMMGRLVRRRAVAGVADASVPAAAVPDAVVPGPAGPRAVLPGPDGPAEADGTAR